MIELPYLYSGYFRVEWVSHCPPVTVQEAQFALWNYHSLCIGMNQAEKSLPTIFPSPFIWLSKCLQSYSFTCLTPNLANTEYLQIGLKWLFLKLFLAVNQCCSLWHVFKKCQLSWFTNDVRFPYTLLCIWLLDWGMLERKLQIHTRYAY